MLVFRLRTTVQRGGVIEIPSQWTEQGRRVAVEVVEREGGRKDAVVYRRTLAKGERTKRGLTALAICWGLALCSIPIVFFHFFLVPLFALLGPVLCFVKMKQERLILGGLVECPQCGGNSTVGKQSEDWPLLLACEGCNTRLNLNLSQASEDAA